MGLDSTCRCVLTFFACPRWCMLAWPVSRWHVKGQGCCGRSCGHSAQGRRHGPTRPWALEPGRSVWGSVEQEGGAGVTAEVCAGVSAPPGPQR